MNPEKSPQSNNDSWDMSDVPAFDEKLLSPVEDIKHWSNEYNTAEQQFAAYAKDNRIAGDSYRDTLLKYEGDIAFSWQKLQKSSNEAMSNRLIRSAYELADTQALGVVEPSETIEAATGIFYNERANELREKLVNTEQTEEVVANQNLLRQTWRKVMAYIEASTDYDFLHRDYNAYQNARRTCHNHMIEQLNNLNSLADQYHTTRFTARDFMTNDFDYNQRYDRTGKLNHRANYDRETVLAYFRTVFQQDFETMERKGDRIRSSLSAGMQYYD